MLNKIASKVISSIFYEYIEAIDESQLEVALWSGSVHLENVNIKTDALINQSIPFIVKKGIIGTIDLKLPWTKLSSEPCEITIKNVYLVANFAENPILTDDFQQSTEKPTENQTDDAANDDQNKNVSQKGVLTGLLGKIVDNLKFYVENVHIRVEIPYGGKYFAMGIILVSIHWLSVNEKGEPIFVDVNTPVLRKNAEITNFAVYIDTNATPVSTDPTGFLKDMQDEITSTNHEFLLNPITFQAKIKISKEEELPKSKSDSNISETANGGKVIGLHTKVKISMDNLNLLLYRQQWKCVLELQRLFIMFNRRRMYSICGRPDHLPRSDRSSSYWWRYAHRAALEKLKKEQLDPSCIIQILKNRKEYLDLYSENRRQNRRSSIELMNLEETLDANAITMLRILSKNEYDSRIRLMSSDSDEFFEIVTDDTFSGPFGIFLLIKSFNLKLAEDSGSSITRIVSNTLRMEYKKSGFSSFSGFSFANFQLINDMNPNFPYLLKTDSPTVSNDNDDDLLDASNQLIVCYESEPNKPPKIALTSPPLVFAFDYGYIKKIGDFLSREKQEIEAHETDKSGNLPATVVQIQQAIDTHVSYSVNIVIKAFRFNFLYDVIEGNNYFAFVFNDIAIKSIPNLYFDAEDFTSLYDHFDIDFGNAALVINDKQFSSDFAGSLGLDFAIASSDLFPLFKMEANVNSELTVNLSQFELNFLIQLYFYIADILYPFQSSPDTFQAENSFILNFSNVNLDINYRGRHLYNFEIVPIIISIVLKEHTTFVNVKTQKITAYEYFDGNKNLFLESSPAEKDSFIDGYVGCLFEATYTVNKIQLDFGNSILHSTKEPLNFLINYFRFTEFEEKMGLIDKPDPMNFRFKSKYDTPPVGVDFTMIVHPLLWHMNNGMAKLTTDFFKYALTSSTEAMDMYIYVVHPVLVTDQLHDFHTILDTNPDPENPFKMEFHKFKMCAYLSDTKFTLQYLWFTHLCSYLFSLFTYGKVEDTAPGSMLYTAIDVDVKNLELTVGYKPEINDYLIMKTPHLFMNTPVLPTKFQIVFESLDVFHFEKLVMQTPNVTIDMIFNLGKYKEGQMFSQVPHEKEDIKKLIDETNTFLSEKHDDDTYYATCLWFLGITMDFKIKDITVNYTHHFCHTFKKCIYSFWDYDGPADRFATEFHCFFNLENAHVPLDKSEKFADLVIENFKFRYTDRQEFEFGDVSIVPLLDIDASYYPGSIIRNMEKIRREEEKKENEKKKKKGKQPIKQESEIVEEKEIPPIMTFEITEDNLVMIFNNMNILIHPTFIIPLFYYILGCPFFGEPDDPKSDKAKEFVFMSDAMYLTILTKKDFYNFTLIFGFQLNWGVNDFIVNIINLIAKADNRTNNLIEPFNIEYKKVLNNEDFYANADQTPNQKPFLYSKQALMTELKMMFTVTDLILFSQQFNLLMESFSYENVPIQKSDVISTDNGSDKIDIKVMTMEVVLCHSQPGVNAKFPFLKLFISSFDILSVSENDLYQVKCSIIPSISMMNFTSGTWDILLEPFCIDFLVKYTDTFKEFTISTDQEINVNISSNFIREILQFGSDLNLDNYRKEEEGKSLISFISIENRTGSDVVIFRENDKVVPLSAGALIQLSDLPAKQILSVSFGNSIDQLCNFKPESIVYPTFIHRRCVVNSFPSNGTRLITLSSPFAVENKTGIDLEIYNVSKHEKSLLGVVEAYKTFPIPYNVFLSDGFIFKEPSMSLDLNHEVFKHKKWRTKISKSIDILTPNGPLSCVIREDIDPNQNIGFMHIIPSVTFYNEMPVDLIVQLSRSESEIRMKPGEVVDVASIGSAELNFRCRVRIDGYDYSKSKLISIAFNNSKSGKFFITKTGEPEFSIGISTMTHHTVDQSQASIIFYSPCIFFNLLGQEISVTPHDEEALYHFDKFGTDYLILPFASKAFFKSRHLYAHLKIPTVTRWSKRYIDCTATGMNDVIFLPRKKQSNLFVPIHYKVSQAEPPCFHSRIVTLVPALSIYNELDIDIMLEPESIVINDVNNEEEEDPEPADNPILLENSSSSDMKIDLGKIETFHPNVKTSVLCANPHFSYRFTINGYSVCDGLILSSPVKTVFRLFNDDGENYMLIECEVVEDGFGLCAHFRRPSFPSPFIICNFLSDVELSGYQILRRNAFVFKPMTTSLFALDSPFGQQGMVLQYKDRSILIGLSEETIPLPLNGTPFTIEIRTVTNGNFMVTISRDPVIITRNLFNLSVTLNGMAISLIDSMYRELCLISFGKLNCNLSTTQTDYSLSLTLDSFQVDDQSLTTAFPVILNGSSTKRNKFLQVFASFYRGAPFLISFNTFTFTMQKIIIYADLAFISDFFTMFMDTFYSKPDGKRKISEIHPPLQTPESDSVGNILSFKKFRLNPILLEVNYRSVTGRPTTLPIDPDMPITIFKLVGNITGAHVCLNCVILKNFRAPRSFLQRNLMNQYKNSLMSQIWALTGHSDILFNTVGIAESFTSDVSSYYYDPDIVETGSDEIPAIENSNENQENANVNNENNNANKIDASSDNSKVENKNQNSSGNENKNENEAQKNENGTANPVENEANKKFDEAKLANSNQNETKKNENGTANPIENEANKKFDEAKLENNKENETQNNERNASNSIENETNKQIDQTKSTDKNENDSQKSENGASSPIENEANKKFDEAKLANSNENETSSPVENEANKKFDEAKLENNNENKTSSNESEAQKNENETSNPVENEANKKFDEAKLANSNENETQKNENGTSNPVENEANKKFDEAKLNNNNVEYEANKKFDEAKYSDNGEASNSILINNKESTDGTTNEPNKTEKRGPKPPLPPQNESAFIQGIPHDLERQSTDDEYEDIDSSSKRLSAMSSNKKLSAMGSNKVAVRTSSMNDPAKSAIRARQAFGSILQSGEGFLRGVSTLFSISSFGHRSINTGGLNQSSSDTVKDGFVSLGTGIVDGLVGVVMDPVEGGKKDGVRGAFVGIGKGLAGIFMRPIAGLLDAGAGIIGGVRSAIKNDNEIILRRHRIPRTYMLTKVDKYDPVRAQIMLLIQEQMFSAKDPNETMCAFVDDPTAGCIFCLCTSSFYIVVNTEKGYIIKKTVSIDKVVDTTFENRRVIISVRNLGKIGQKENYSFLCKDEFTAEEIATLIHSHKIEEDVFK